jgi:hypothetical protein
MKTGKEKAFALFDKGFVPSSPEVKALGLKSKTRYNYFRDYRMEKGIVSGGSETIGGIAEPVEPIKPEEEIFPESREETGPSEAFEDEGLDDESPEPPPEAHPAVTPRVEPEESINEVTEAKKARDKDGKETGPERKIATTVSMEGIRCTIFLSLETLSLYNIAASTQRQLAKDGDAGLSLGDFLDACARDYFEVRGKKLGLVSAGGK